MALLCGRAEFIFEPRERDEIEEQQGAKSAPERETVLVVQLQRSAATTVLAKLSER